MCQHMTIIGWHNVLCPRRQSDHYLYQWYCCTRWKKFGWNLYINWYIFIEENPFQDVVCKVAVILSLAEWVKLLATSKCGYNVNWLILKLILNIPMFHSCCYRVLASVERYRTSLVISQTICRKIVPILRNRFSTVSSQTIVPTYNIGGNSLCEWIMDYFLNAYMPQSASLS